MKRIKYALVGLAAGSVAVGLAVGGAELTRSATAHAVADAGSGAQQPAGAAGTKAVAYKGLQVSVPATWPVYDLTKDPTRCLRTDQSAVYLGDPSPTAQCPAHAVGRSDALWIEPATSGAAIGQVDDQVDRVIEAQPAGGNVVLHAYYATNHDRAAQIIASTTGGTSGATTPSPAVQGTPAGFRYGTDALAGKPYVGKGFDTCAAPAISDLRAWSPPASPYHAVNVYIGGVNRACPSPITADWVSQAEKLGWTLIPTYVGRQSPCTTAGNVTSFAPGQAAAQAKEDADDAAKIAQRIGLPQNTVVFFDMEAYGPCNGVEMKFLSAWNDEMYAQGYVPGHYGSVASLVHDLTADRGAQPTELWAATADGNASTGDPAFPANLWTGHTRINQYTAGHNETYGGVSLNIDSDQCDFYPVYKVVPPRGIS